MSTTHADLGLLTGPPAGELMAAVLAAADARLLRWSPRQVDHRPGIRTTVSYLATVRWPDETVTEETIGASSGELPNGVALLSDGHTEIGMWRFPHDPDLPALPAACDPDLLRRLTAQIGLNHGDGPVRTRIRAYRPRRRAVVQVDTPDGTAFLKVVRSGKVRALHERHRTALAAGCPVPAPLGWTDDGLLVLAALPGTTLRDLLTGTRPVRLDVDSVVDVLDTLPAELGTGHRRRTWGQKAPYYAEVVAAVAPELAERARAVASTVDHPTPEGPDIVVHGDFYESQLTIGDGRVGGLLDIDTAGRGERLDDAGCLLAHLAVLAQLHPGRAATINALGLRAHRRFARDLDPAALARRTAAVLLSLATGPHRVQERNWRANTARRLALAERWLDHASTTDRPR